MPVFFVRSLDLEEDEHDTGNEQSDANRIGGFLMGARGHEQPIHAYDNNHEANDPTAYVSHGSSPTAPFHGGSLSDSTEMREPLRSILW
jgi:hypothetical protein